MPVPLTNIKTGKLDKNNIRGSGMPEPYRID